jgi:hypothetical protein
MESSDQSPGNYSPLHPILIATSAELSAECFLSQSNGVRGESRSTIDDAACSRCFDENSDMDVCNSEEQDT